MQAILAYRQITRNGNIPKLFVVFDNYGMISYVEPFDCISQVSARYKDLAQGALRVEVSKAQFNTFKTFSWV